MKHPHLSTHAGLLGMAALWGASWPWGRVVAQSMPPLAAAALRFVIASAVLLLWLHGRHGLRTLRALQARQWAGLAAAAAVGVLGYATFFMLGLRSVPASKAAMVVALNPAATLLLAGWLFREPLNWRMGIGMAMAVGGALLAIRSGTPASAVGSAFGPGEWLVLGCAACWVAYTLVGRAVLAGVDALTTAATTALLGAAMLLLASLALEGVAAWHAIAQAPPSAWASLGALALGSTALAYAWYFHGIQRLGAGAAGAYLALVPVFGMLFSGLWLGEELGPALALGALVAVAGMALMQAARPAAVTRRGRTAAPGPLQGLPAGSADARRGS
ncbi:MAG TPA: DMT family transporter [Pseudorhodoferax sp.]|jgi:drug/metabolite transporter (DMT)-like permease|nr:DMT family transporter [Pseudorhodoferax sp.]